MKSDKIYQTPSQTVGPYFAYGLTPEQYLYDHKSICNGNLILDDSIPGERISIRGKVLDGEGNPIPDSMIEIWQADAEGNYLKDPLKFHGFGRFGTGSEKDNNFIFKTIKPGSISGQAPHINVLVFMRGLLSHAYTRMYFSDESEANSNDTLLNSIEENRRSTLIAKKLKSPDSDISQYEFNIIMQGESETVFFDV